jgi:exopolysaccharide production protein ExoQ
MWAERFHSGYIFAVGAVLAPALGVYAPNLIAPLAMIVVAGLLLHYLLRFRRLPPVDQQYARIAGGLLAWSGLTLIWAIHPLKAAEKWATVFLMVPLLLIAFAIVKGFSPSERRVSRYGILGGVALAILLIGVEIAMGGSFTRLLYPDELFTVELFNRLPSILLILVWPAAAVLWDRSYILAAVLLAACLFLGWLLPSEAALAGFAVGLAVFALCILMAPVMTYTLIPPDTVRDSWSNVNPSLLHRLQIWDFTSRHIVEKPIIGWGFNAARDIPGGDERYLVKDRNGLTIGQGDRLPLHPHNGALQVWLELGAPGALLVAAFLALAAYRAGGIGNRGHRAIALGLLSTIVPIWLFSFGIWQGWWLGVMSLAVLSFAATQAEAAP